MDYPNLPACPPGDPVFRPETVETGRKAYFRAMKWMPVAVLAAFLLTACNNDLEVAAPWKDIPVVWGMISKSDTAHYVRVEKAFLDPAVPAATIAQIPDSLYYENATVSLRRVSTNTTTMLQRVDGTLEGYPRDTGYFADAPNYLYKVKGSGINLVIDDIYELRVDRGEGKELVTAQTIILGAPRLRNPVKGASLSFRTNQNTNFNWDAVPNAGIYDFQVRFHYRERSASTGNIFLPQSVQWTETRNLTEDEYAMPGTNFYNSLKALIDADPGATRLFDSIDVNIWCAGTELQEFIRITEANTGITGTQDFPTYSNVKPDGTGFGIFTSRNVSRNTGFLLTQQSLDSLSDGSITKLLNFQ